MLLFIKHDTMSLILTTVILDRDVMEEHYIYLILSLFYKFSVISIYELLRKNNKLKIISLAPNK